MSNQNSDKTLKIIGFSVAAIIAVVIFVKNFDKTEKYLINSWEYSSGVSVPEGFKTLKISFDSDNYFSIELGTDKVTGEWVLEDDVILLKPKKGNEDKIKIIDISENKMTVEWGKYTITLVTI